MKFVQLLLGRVFNRGIGFMDSGELKGLLEKENFPGCC